MAFFVLPRKSVEAEGGEGETSWRKLKDSWPSVLLLVLAVAIPGWGFYLFFLVGEGFVFQGYVLGAALLAFIFFQLPRLRPPAVYVYLRRSEDGETPTRENLTRHTVKRGTQTLFFFFVGNTGVNVYEACEASISLPRKCLTPVGDEQAYQEVDFRQVPEIQKVNNAAHYRGGTISPGSVLALPLWLRAEAEADPGPVRVEFACSSRWGSWIRFFEVQIDD